jgi:pyruvate/2-oxoglutarate/acetoin dehydrogenase E1 component
MSQLKMIRAMCEAFDEELQRDHRVCLFGQDVGEFVGAAALPPDYKETRPAPRLR